MHFSQPLALDVAIGGCVGVGTEMLWNYCCDGANTDINKNEKRERIERHSYAQAIREIYFQIRIYEYT